MYHHHLSIGTPSMDKEQNQLKQGVSAYYGKAFPVPHGCKAALCQEVERLVKLGVLELQLDCIRTKKNDTIRFISDF